MISPSAIHGHDLLMFIEVNGQLLVPGTARWNKLGYYGDNIISSVKSDDDWQIQGAVYVAKFTEFQRHQHKCLVEDWSTIHNALDAILAQQKVQLKICTRCCSCKLPAAPQKIWKQILQRMTSVAGD